MRAIPSSPLIVYGIVVVLCAVTFTLGRFGAPLSGYAVTFHNSSEQLLTSLQLDFGSPDTQSRIQTFRIAPGADRTLLLNHTPGMGFNVKAIFADRQVLEFCALKGDDRQAVMLYLKP